MFHERDGFNRLAIPAQFPLIRHTVCNVFARHGTTAPVA
jgi:hypothetical protein